MSGRKRLGGLQHSSFFDNFQPDRRSGRRQLSGESRHQLGRAAIERTDRDGQRCRLRGVTIGEKARPTRQRDKTGNKDNPKPTRQSPAKNCDEDSREACTYRDRLQFFSLH